MLEDFIALTKYANTQIIMKGENSSVLQKSKNSLCFAFNFAIKCKTIRKFMQYINKSRKNLSFLLMIFNYRDNLHNYISTDVFEICQNISSNSVIAYNFNYKYIRRVI